MYLWPVPGSSEFFLSFHPFVFPDVLFDLLADFTYLFFFILRCVFPFLYEGPNFFVFVVRILIFLCCRSNRCYRLASLDVNIECCCRMRCRRVSCLQSILQLLQCHPLLPLSFCQYFDCLLLLHALPMLHPLPFLRLQLFFLLLLLPHLYL